MTRRQTFGFLVSFLIIGACSGASEISNSSSTVVVAITTETLTTAAIPTTTLPETVPSTSTVVSTSTTTSAPAQEPLPNTELFDAAIKLHTLDAGSRDVSAAVVFQGQVIHTFAASVAKSSRPVNADTNFRIASVSKILTAETVLK